ncbi:MAG TPA: L-threonylcarbamoyladenylate synthase [Solirubrobacterales bacterium]|nr:L-threonylcarbamoyladenylate synthase [Solirubrobacterales bacterium]
MTRTVSIADGGAGPAREALEDCVRGGGVAVFPADTLYGLGCDPSSGEAIARINSLKGRDEAKPSAVMFFAPLAMRELLSTLGPRTREALGTLLPGAVTLVVHNPQSLYPLAGPEHPDRLGIRLIEGSLAGAASPLLQTSANRSGEQAPSRFDQVDSRILDGADLAIDGGELGGEPSTVVDLTALESDGSWRVLREGAVSRAQIGARLGEPPG